VTFLKKSQGLPFKSMKCKSEKQISLHKGDWVHRGKSWYQIPFLFILLKCLRNNTVPHLGYPLSIRLSQGVKPTENGTMALTLVSVHDMNKLQKPQTKLCSSNNQKNLSILLWDGESPV
jgi:hypothetical protein